MARSEVFNMDCIEYMRSLPSKYFDLAVCDPPFGKGNDDTLDNGGDSTREDASKDTTSWNRLKGGRREKYYSPQKQGGQNGSENGSKGISSRNRFQGGTWATRYRVPMGGVLN